MNDLNIHELVTKIFGLLRQQGFNLGIGELLAVRHVIDAEWKIDNLQELNQVLQLLWCSSREQLVDFNFIWESVESTLGYEGSSRQPIDQFSEPWRYESKTIPPAIDEIPHQVSSATEPIYTTSKPVFNILPVKAPPIAPLQEKMVDLQAYFPVSHREMTYALRQIRRPLTNGPANILDIEKTVDLTAKQGFFLSPVYRRQNRNSAHLTLFADQGGSMVPFHHFSRELIDVAQYESMIEQVNTYYFHDIPTINLSLDPKLTRPVDYNQVLSGITPDTSVAIISDAGAARGQRSLNRIQATNEFLTQIRQYTNFIVWLNPVPEGRWPGSSAQIIRHLVPMYQLDFDGLNKAIDVMRGTII